jgi:hypothetical protein
MSTKIRVVAFAAFVALAGTVQGQGAPSVATGRYSGSLRGTFMSGVSDASRISGSADISALPDRPGVFKVELRVSTSSGSSAASVTNLMQWSVSPGRCGSRIQLLLGPTELPALEIRTGGNAELTWQGPINLASNGSYQLVVFDKGTNQESIVACANLKYSEPKK